MNTDPRTLAALAELACAVADYETAWRASLGHAPDDKVTDCGRAVEAARERFDRAIGDGDESEAIGAVVYGALVQASARVRGERPPESRGHLETTRDAETFLYEQLAE